MSHVFCSDSDLAVLSIHLQNSKRKADCSCTSYVSSDPNPGASSSFKSPDFNPSNVCL
jgi:hypothetical protein